MNNEFFSIILKKFKRETAVVFLITGAILFPALLLLNKTLLDSNTRRIEKNLISNFQQRATILRNTGWGLQRYSYLEDQASEADRKIISSVKSTFLPGFTYGIDSDYFILLNANEKVVMELRGGALTDRKSNVEFQDWKDVISKGEKLYYRPCKINDRPFFCLLNSPYFREYLKSNERFWSLIAIEAQELYQAGRVFESNDLSILPRPIYRFELSMQGDKDDTSQGGFFTKKRQLDTGFWIVVDTDRKALFERLIFIWIGTSIILSLLWWVLSYRFETKLRAQSELNLLKLEKTNLEKVRSVINGVLHDIKSPFTALKVIASGETEPDKRYLLDLLTKRMREIIRNLEGKSNAGCANRPSQLPIDLLLKLVIKEKANEWNGKMTFVEDNIQSGLWASGHFSEFFRMMSNLINNAAQATKEGGSILLSATLSKENKIVIEIRDRGCGIPTETLVKILTVGGSYNKVGGSGFGLMHAKQTSQDMGGGIDIVSAVNEGTTVTIEIPSTSAPSWGKIQIKMNQFDTIVIIDDEEIFGEIWTSKLSGSGKEIKFYMHPSQVPKDLLNNKNVFYIVDNNYGSDTNAGLSFIEKNGPERSVLFTSDWWLNDTQEEVRRIHTSLVGKDVLEWTKIEAI